MASSTRRASVLHILPIIARVYRQCIGAHLSVRPLASTARRNTHRHILTTFVGLRRCCSTDSSMAPPKTPIRTLLAEETIQGRVVYIEEQLQEIKTTLGEAHQNYGLALIRYAEVLSELGQFEKSEQHCRQGVHILERVYGKDNEYVAAGLSNLSGYLAAQILPKAAAGLTSAAPTRTATPSAGHVPAQSPKLEEAIAVCQRALATFEKTLGRPNEFTRQCFHNYRRLLTEAGKGEEAAKLREQWESERKVEVPAPADPPKELISEAMAEFAKEPPRKIFDPPGMWKPRQFAVAEMKAFLAAWKESGHSLEDIDLHDALVEEIRGLDVGEEWVPKALGVKKVPLPPLRRLELHAKKKADEEISEDTRDEETVTKDGEQHGALSTVGAH